MVDADYFKGINDRFGHAVGDKVLEGLARILRQACEGRGVVGRYGGEEFCIVIAGLSEKEAEMLAEHIRMTVASVTTWLPRGENVTISIGLSSFSETHCEIAELVKMADEALYAAKAGGRNRLVNWKNLRLHGGVSAINNRGVSSSLVQPTSGHQKFGGRLMDESMSYLDWNRLVDHTTSIIQNDGGTSRFALAHINVDNFRYFNDCYGNDVGNELLEKIVHRIMMRTRSTDMVARIEGDQFLLLINPFDGKERVLRMLERVFDELKYPFLIQENELFGSFSMGVSVYPENGRAFEILQKNAKVAMRHAKRAERGKLIFFDDSMNLADANRMQAEQALRLAIRDRKFCCAFQPKIDISNHRVVGLEALVRWRDADGEIHAPGEFIDLAIELGLIDQITNTVLEIAVGSLGQLDAVFGSHTTLSINIASQLAGNAEFMLPFARALKESGHADRIILEFTEESFISRGIFQTRIIPILRDIGVRVSIDDFGVGYSSLGTLADIDADELKIDRSFISSIHERPRNQSILRTIASLAESLKMTVVAEGVETHEELAYLHAATSIRCVQGFYFSRPFYVDDMSSMKKFFVESRAIASERRPPAASVA